MRKYQSNSIYGQTLSGGLGIPLKAFSTPMLPHNASVICIIGQTSYGG
jgi:hypothetical protein